MTARSFSLVVCLACAVAADVVAQTLERGTVIDPVPCASDPSQTYALYLPSTYTPDKQWSVLLAFHPAARGRSIVETYQAAAERYGYIVAASNNSRNGPYAASAVAARAMSADVERRFSIDRRRVYLTGFSGGARLSTGIALRNETIAGVIASSAGFPDSGPRTSVRFPIFATAGTEDFNYIEMRLMDRTLTSPHCLAVFRGGHALPPAGVALEAIEWMELQAMRSGRRNRDDGLLRALVDKRRARAAASTEMADTVHLLGAIVADFTGLVDVTADASQLEALSRRPDVKKALKRERDADNAEARMLQEIFEFESLLTRDDRRGEAMTVLRERLSRLSKAASADGDTPERSQARRVLQAVVFGASTRTEDHQYLMLVGQYRQPLR